MRTLHLFAGAGGGLLADLILGHTPVAAVEWDAYCCRILRERAAEGWFPDLRVHEADVRLFDPSEYAGRVDCIAAGFPCQDISKTGNGAGMAEGTRSGLWSEVVRVARIVRPRYLFLENVATIVSIRPGLDAVLGDIANLGFDARWCCIRAADAGAPHQRERWWLFADSDSGGQPPSIQPPGRIPANDISCVWESFGTTFNADRLASLGCFRGKANGLAADVDRLKALGNGQVPIQAALAWRILTA